MSRIRCEECGNLIPSERVKIIRNDRKANPDKLMLCIKCQEEYEKEFPKFRYKEPSLEKISPVGFFSGDVF